MKHSRCEPHALVRRVSDPYARACVHEKDRWLQLIGGKCSDRCPCPLFVAVGQSRCDRRRGRAVLARKTLCVRSSLSAVAVENAEREDGHIRRLSVRKETHLHSLGRTDKQTGESIDRSILNSRPIYASFLAKSECNQSTRAAAVECHSVCCNDVDGNERRPFVEVRGLGQRQAAAGRSLYRLH